MVVKGFAEFGPPLLRLGTLQGGWDEPPTTAISDVTIILSRPMMVR
jgi:hypothetical protein